MHQLTESKTMICWLRGSLPQSPGTVSSIYSHRHIHHQRHPAILPATKNFWTRVSPILLSAAIMTRAWTPSSWYSWHSCFGGAPWKSLVSSCYRKVMIFRAVILIQKVKLMGVKGNFFFPIFPQRVWNFLAYWKGKRIYNLMVCWKLKLNIFTTNLWTHVTSKMSYRNLPRSNWNN